MAGRGLAPEPVTEREVEMPYTAKNYDRLLGIPGFSDPLLKTHFRFYEAGVTHLNEMIVSIKGVESGTEEYAEAKTMLAWEFNRMRLHETYFENMTKKFWELDQDSELARQMVVSFGSVQAWKRDFKAVSGGRGVGWAVLAWDPGGRNLFNIWINEQDVGQLFYTVSLLVNDVFEHAYITDYGMERKSYVEAFMKVIDWVEVGKRFAGVVKLTISHAY
jgi:superoxide dismutase, Fe-Mn family